MKTILRYVLLLPCLLTTASCHRLMADADEATFEYREIHLPDGYTRESKALGLNSVDRDWGLWGHHLNAVLPQNYSHAVLATVNGEPCEDQFCFSSDQLYTYIRDYIDDNFGKKHTQRFAILPNDNAIVCQCQQCVAKGCTPEDASPAVFDMLERLSAEFPHHLFFTSYYLTTRNLPTRPMPKNTGVLISAIDYPLCAHETPQEVTFAKLLQDWAKVTPNVYVWDYIRNFDDYFTPFPVMAVMQRRFQLYAKSGVHGIFLNGSGTDYSTFSRIHTHLLAELMQHPNADWHQLVREQCSQLYPVVGEALADFILQQEDSVLQQSAPLPLYEGVERIRQNYLHEADFLTFHDKLQRLLPQTQGKEHQEVSLMVATLMLPRLELKRIHGDIAGASPMLEQLSSVKEQGVHVYSETCWTVSDYVRDYDEMLRLAKANDSKNLLLGQMLIPLTLLDEGYTNISLLTDGLCSLPSNYHCGLLINSADPNMRIALPYIPDIRHIRVGLVSNPPFHIELPQTVTLSLGEQEIATVTPKPISAVAGRTTIEFNIPIQPSTEQIVLTLRPSPGARTIALDEIEGF